MVHRNIDIIQVMISEKDTAVSNKKQSKQDRIQGLTITLRQNYGGEATNLYRVIGVREFDSIVKNKAFLYGGNSLEGRQFALTEAEVLKYAATDASKVAVVKAVVPEAILKGLEHSRNIDANIFKNGVITVQPEVNSSFNKAIISIELKEGIGKKQ